MTPQPPNPTPNPSPDQTPSPSGDPAPSADSSRDSSKAPSPSAFVSDPGNFDAGRAAARGEQVAQETPADELELAPLLEWEREQVRDFLVAQGALAHNMAGKGETDWIYTEAELIAISGPLTRILNQHDATRALAGSADPLALALSFGAYAGRSWQERMAAIRAEQAEPEVPASGVAAPEGTGPDADVPGPPDPIDPNELQWRTT